MDELDAVREEIRRVDQDMVVLFEKRMALSGSGSLQDEERKTGV